MVWPAVVLHGAPRRAAAAGAVLALVASVCVAAQVVAPSPASAAATVPAPAGWWQFNEGSGTTTADSSGNSHIGTLGAGVTWAAPEVGTHSIATNGTAAGAVTVTGAVVNTSLSYTVSAWVYLNALGGGNQTFVGINGLASPTGTTISGFYLQFQGGTDQFAYTVRASDTTASTTTQALGPANVAAHTWYHLVAVDNVGAGTIALYINGALQASTAFTTAWQATGNTTIGQAMYSGAATDFVNGKIDDVALYSSALTTAQVAALNPPTIATGLTTSCMISSGNASCWGDNSTGTLGNNSTINSSVPVPVYTGGVLAGLTLTQISVGSDFACALSSAGAAYCWGSGANTSGQLGDGSTAQSNVPVLVSGGLTFTQIDTGSTFACALTSAGAAYCWGNDGQDQLGNTTLATNSSVPVAVTGGLTFAQISAGTSFVCALTTAAAAYCWGKDNAGQLGNAAAANPQTTPLAVTTTGALSGVTVTQISAALSGSTTCALSSAGAAYCWGFGTNGELGNGATTAAQTTAVAVTTSGVLSGVTLTQITGGQDQTCALGSTGAAYCWGGNGSGDLGINSTTQSLTAVAVSTSGVLSGKVLTQISASGNFITCALDSFGAAYCWGLNSLGQAGNPDTGITFLVPGTVAPSQATTVAAGNIHSCEIRSGKAYCGGDNSNGELGNSNSMNSSVPVAAWTGGVLSGVTLTEITTGTNFSCALSAAGAAYCWGLGTSGQLGNNATTSSSLPVPVYTGGVLAGVTLTQITAGNALACALSAAGAAYCWGSGTNGALGNGTTTTTQDTPVAVTTTGVLAGVTLTQITNNNAFACALSSAGAAYCWGYNSTGQLGNSSTTQSGVPVVVTATGTLSGITLTQISAGSNSACALSAAGAAYCWGGGAIGQLGNGSTTAAQSTAVAVTATGVLAGVNLTQIAVGATFACAVGNTGAAYCWGANASGQLGNPATAVNEDVPVAVMSQATMIASGYDHSCLLRNGKAWCWGDDTYGELGNNTTTATPQSTPVPVYTGGVLAGLTLIQISAGEDWTCALSAAGAAYCWGNNSIAVSGDAIALGNNTATASSQAVLVSGGLTFTQISVGGDFACALTSAGVAYCWGNNKNDQMGNGGASLSSVPGAVTATSGSKLYQLTLTQIAAGSSYACTLASTGAAYCWGLGTSGQLGNSASSTSSTAVAVTVSGVLSGVALVQITTGGTSTCALGSAGAAYCWGAGGSGQLGNGSTTAIQNTAVAVTATSTGMPLTQITAGTSFACAVDVTGAAYCWGLGTPGDQLGNNLGANSSVPVAVTATGVLAGVSLFQISSGQLATCTQDTTGAFYCWGINTNGQLGNASTTSSDVPVVAVSIVPGAPTSVAAFPASTTAIVYWVAPASLGTGTLTGYIATASPGSATCSTTTAVTCTITGLTNGTTYTVTVVTETTDGNSANSTAATVTPWPPATQIAAGWTHACVLSAGLAYCWGDNTYGQLGNNSTTSSATPVAVYTGGVLSGLTLTKISSGQYYTCALSSAGNVYCWGADNDGQLGNDTTATSYDAPVAVYTTGTPMAGVAISQIAVGQVSVCALSTVGAAYCWGASPNGQLGNGTSGGNVPYPVAVTTSGLPAGVVFVQLSSAGSNTCALASNGAAYCWGFNAHGQIGNGNTGTNALTPAAVTTSGVLSGVTLAGVTTGYDYACGLSSTGAAYCWGLNTNDTLGNTSATNPSNTPVAVTATPSGAPLYGVTLTQLSGGYDHVCALSTTGAGYCWGDDTYGQLGNNSTSGSANAPVAAYTSGLLSGITLSQVSSGAYFTCVLDTNSYAYCWGANNDTLFDVNTGSQLGNDSTTQSSVAVYVGPQAPTSVTATAGNTTATVSWTAPVYLNNATLTGYTASSAPGTATCTTAAGTTSCGLTGLTNGTTYTVTVIDTTSTGTSAPSSPAATVEPVGLSLTGPSSLTWAVTGTGVNQSTVDPNSADQQFTVGDTLTAGWNVVVSATTFTNGTHTLPNTSGTFNFTGSLSSSLATTAPTATCVGSCTLPADTTTYPVNIITAASPTAYKVYDTPASTGEGVMIIGGSTAANPIGWWIQMPASGYTGTYTSTVTLEVVSGP